PAVGWHPPAGEPRRLPPNGLTVPAAQPGISPGQGDSLRISPLALSYLAGEPIQARPVGRAEKLWRWCRRNRSLASLLAVLTVIVVAVGVSSTVAAFRFADKARAEADAKEKADRNFQRAVAAIQVQAQTLRSLSRVYLSRGGPMEAVTALRKAQNIYAQLVQE